MDAVINDEIISGNRKLKRKDSSNLRNILNTLYHKNKHNCFSSIIQDINYIPIFLNYLIDCGEKEKIEILDFLNKNINYNPNNCEIYSRYFKTQNNENLSLIFILMNIFLSDTNPQILTLCREIIEGLVNYINISRNIFEYLYQQIAEYFRKDIIITEKRINTYIYLLKILYGEKQIEYRPNNYFYFTGNGGIKVSEKSLEDEKIRMNSGFTIMFWFRIEGFPTEETSNICDLVTIKGSKNNKIQISLNIDKLFIKNLDKTDYIYKFQKGWNNFSFILKPKVLLKDTEFKIFPPEGTLKTFKVPNFDCDCDITEMMFFHNFIGQVSSIMFINKALNEDNLKVLKEFPHGFYNEKKIIKFLKYGNMNYMNNSISNFQFKKNNITNKYTDSVNSILSSLRIMYVPTRVNDKIIYDVTEKYNGTFITQNMNYVHNFYSFQKNIFYIGGIKNIIPIFELVCKYKLNLDLKNIMNEETFLNLCQLISIIIVDKKNNIKNALETNFFKMISIFLEKIPDYVYTENILKIFLDLGKNLFSIMDECELSIQFFDEILLNERIFTKFPINIQIELWKNLYQFYYSDSSQIRTFMKMNKIILILKYYDQNKFIEYCCENHCSIFKRNELSKVMVPPMNIKINDLANIIQLVVDNLDPEKPEPIQLFISLLTLDISPCLQKYLVEILTNYFKNTKIRDDYKKKNLISMLKGELLDILLYCFNISLIDVRCEIIKLFKEITNPNYKELAHLRLFEDKVIPILKECILPNYLNVVKKFPKQDLQLSSPKVNGLIQSSPATKNLSNKTRVSSDKISLLCGDSKSNIKAITMDRVFDEKPINPYFKILEKQENSQDNIENRDSYFLSIQENDEIFKIEENEIKTKKLVRSQSDASTSPKNIQEIPSNKPLILKKSITGFSNRIRKNRISPERKLKKNLDIDDINKEYKFGGERGEKNITEEESFQEIEKKVKSLAKHCVEFIIEDKQECEKEDIKSLDSFSEKESNEFNQKPIFQPRSVRSHQKINYKNFNIQLDNDMIIEEDVGAENASPGLNTKRSKNSKMSTISKLDKNNSNNSNTNNNNNRITEDVNLITSQMLKPEPNEAITLSLTIPRTSSEKRTLKAINSQMLNQEPNEVITLSNTIPRTSSEKNTLKSVTTFYDDQNYDNLENYFDKEVYENYKNVLYTNLFEWLLNKKESNRIEENSIDYRDTIVNENIIEIFIRFCNLRNINLIQRFLQEIHLLISNNRDNPLILFKNKNFYFWLVETSFKFYQLLQDDPDNNNAMAIYKFGKKIHTELIITTILKEEKLKSEPMVKISNLLSWGIYYKNMYCNQISNFQVNDFIKLLLDELLSSFKDRIKVMSPNINFSIWENFVVFTIFCYEYMTFYNLEKMLKLDASTLTEWNYENIIVPRGIISGLNLEHKSRESTNEVNLNSTNSSNQISVRKNLATELWSDYKLYESLFVVVSKFWDKSIFENDEKSIINKYEKITKDLILNKKQKNNYIEQIKLLFYSFRQENFSYNINLVKVISNMLSITISLMQDEVEIKYWLEDYENFLKFLIIASSNMLNKGELYNQVQETTIDIVCFGLCFLFDEYFNTKRNSTYIKFYLESISNIFTLLCVIYKNISEEINKKKKNMININILGVLGKKPEYNFYKMSVYRIFNEIMVDRNKVPLLNKPLLDSFIQTNFSNITNVFKNEDWKFALTENPFLKQRCKNLFDFNSYENIIKMRYDMMSTYKAFYNTESSMKKNYEIHIIEKGKYIKTIERIIPNYEKCYKEYQNSQFNMMKDKRLLYKCLKKKVFQWRGVWSDKNLFYENNHKLKLKIINHYTSYYAKPLLMNILDIDYYIPIFSKFNSSNLFIDNDNNINYRIVLNIDEILGEETENIKSNKFALISTNNQKLPPNNRKNSSMKSILDNTHRNYIYDIYHNANFTVWKQLEKISNLTIKPFGRYDHYDLFSRSKLNSKSEKYENVFECCYIKLSHHIKGLFSVTKDGITFKPYSNQFTRKKEEKLENLNDFNIDEDCDLEKNTCYGSILTFHHKDKDVVLYYWPLYDIKYVLKKRYYYKKKAIEFFTFSNKSYLFTFKDQTQKDQVMKLFYLYIENKREIKLDQKESKESDDRYIGIENILNNKKITKNETLSNKIIEWANWKISNFEILMFFNLFSNRSYNDITQYPVFPWIIKNYEESKIQSQGFLRELNLPIGMLEIDDDRCRRRKQNYTNGLRDPIFQLGKKYIRNYGSHYSTPMYVSHYLTRLFPVVQIQIELQGDKFDDPNRLFFSIANSFYCVATQQGDLREVIPQFFYMPEMLINLNNLNLGKRIDENENFISIDNVEVPKWSNSVFDFISKMKEILENDDVSYKINEWIDLIFGFRQNGKEAEKCANVFDFFTYEENVNTEILEEHRETLMKSIEFGLTPSQIINKQMFTRFSKEALKRGKQITESKSLKAYGGNLYSSKGGKNKEEPIMLRMKVIETDRVICVYNNNTFNLTRFTPSDFKYNITVESKAYLTYDQEVRVHSRIPYLFNESNVNSPIVIYSNGKIIAQGGYFDGRISVSYTEMNNNKCYNYFVDTQNPILVLKMDKEEKYCFAGSKLGVVYIFRVNEHIWLQHRLLLDHTEEITSICVSNTLNVFATCSLDGYINLYTFPNSKLFRSLKLVNSAPIDDVFLSSYPLPCVVIYSKQSKFLFTYSINGTLLDKEEEDCKCILSPMVFSDINFNDFIIYGTSTGDVKIRKFPSMNLIQKLTISDKSKNNIENRPIKCIDITEDKKFIYLWQYDDVDITLVKDPSITSESSSVNLINMGFGY